MESCLKYKNFIVSAEAIQYIYITIKSKISQNVILFWFLVNPLSDFIVWDCLFNALKRSRTKYQMTIFRFKQVFVLVVSSWLYLCGIISIGTIYIFCLWQIPLNRHCFHRISMSWFKSHCPILFCVCSVFETIDFTTLVGCLSWIFRKSVIKEQTSH